MDNPKPPPDRVLLDDNVRRTVEQTALRKVRGVLDTLEREEQKDQRFRVGIYAACGFLVLLLIWFVGGLILH